jgi:hypothetical protein
MFQRFIGFIFLALSMFHSAIASDVMTKLLGQQPLSCEPTEAFFCRNMHVSCAGKTKVATFAFELKAFAQQGTLTASNSFRVFEELYQDSQVTLGKDALYVIFTPNHFKGYLKLFSTGNYVFRYYPSPEQDGIMSLGQCR